MRQLDSLILISSKKVHSHFTFCVGPLDSGGWTGDGTLEQRN